MPRAGLTPELVVAEAARIADEVGYDRLTLSAVAGRFGVAVPSLYKHVDGFDALRRGVAVASIRELGERLAEAVGRGREEGLHALAHAYRGYAQSHPGCYAATLRAVDPSDDEGEAATRAALDVVLDVLSSYGITGDGAIDATRVFRSALHGFVSLEAAGGFGLPQDVDESFDRLIDVFDAAFSAWDPPRDAESE